ncbi:MAG: PASTA domain-containing protein [Firmicutes bacterium]|nr:PASTA domain-containing protein [Bacillota bacterium]
MNNCNYSKQVEYPDKNYRNGIDEINKKNRLIKYFTYFCLSISLVLMITYFIYTIISSNNLVEQLFSIISALILSIFTLFFIIISLFADNEKGRIFVIIASLLLSFYSGFQLAVQTNFLKLPVQEVVLNFYGKDITEVVSWAEKYNILVEQIYENSDSFPMYTVMSQDLTPGTLVKNINKITITVSDGPNQEKQEEIPNMVGFTVDEVLDYAAKHHLTGIIFKFEYKNDVKKGIVYDQKNEDVEMKRNSKITLSASLGKKDDLERISMISLVGKDLFHGSVWLEQNAISYTVEYGYSSVYKEGTIIKQSLSKGRIIDKERTKSVVITVARNTEITVPDLKVMSASQIATWATENMLKVEFDEEFDDSVERGKVIRSSKNKGDFVEVGDTIKVVISKGQITMIEFTDIDNFRKWADENEISYHIDYQVNNQVKKGNLVSSSHKAGELIKNTDTVQIVISQGGNTTIPNFVGKTKKESEKLCSSSNLTCEFVYSDDSKEKDTVIKQSMKKDSSVPIDTSITLTLSSGKK